MQVNHARWPWTISIALIALGVGCSSDSGVSASKACADEAHAACTKRDTCSPGFNIARVYGDEMTCETRVAAACVGSLDATGTASTPDRIEQCVAQYPNYACADFFDDNPTGSCVPPAGAGAIGAACGAAGQCASTYCALTSTSVCGQCEPLPAAGASCTAAADCGRDLACAIPAGATTGTCAAFVAMSGACISGVNPCASGLSCVGDKPATSTAGICMAAVATVGGACDGARNTMPGCDAELGLACIPTASGSAVGTCQPVTLVGAGATCGLIGTPLTMVVECQAGGQCVKTLPADRTGMCVAAAADGAACDTAAGPPCLAPAKCVTGGAGTAGTCTPPNASTCH